MTTQFACSSVITPAELACDCDLPASEATKTAIVEAAADMLAMLSDAPVGRCVTAYRPCRDEWCDWEVCRCCGLKGIHLPGMRPEVTEVKIDGTIVSASEYKVIITPARQYVLIRYNPTTGAQVSWPRCQKVWLPVTAEGTFQITVEAGPEVTEIMKLAVAEIACDIAKALNGQDHELPDGVVSATMNGLTIDWRRFSDPTDQNTMTFAGLPWTQRYLTTMPAKKMVQVLAPELDDGWSLFQVAA